MLHPRPRIMPQSEDNPYKQFWMLGVAMMVPLTLVSGPLVGYLLWRFIAVKLLGLSSRWMLPLIALGVLASGIQVARLIKQIQDSDSTRKL